MRPFTFATVSGAVLASLLFAGVALARDHSALTGTWELIPTRSDFAGQPALQTGTVTIRSQDDVIIISRSFKYEGATETFFYNDSIGSENNSTIHTGKDLKTKTRWDHDVLKVTTTQAGAVTTESYLLAADGTLQVNVVRSEQKPFTLIFQHK